MTDKIIKMDDDALITHVNRLADDAKDYIDSSLMENWAQSQKYYFGDKMGNEKKGQSQVVSKDVSDAIDWMMPSLMDIFTGGDEAVKFEPRTPEDVAEAQQKTDYINYLFYRKNKGFMTLHNFFKDALMFKLGIVKHYFEEEVKVSTELYSGLDEQDLENLLMDEDVELIERTDVEDGTIEVRISRKEVTSGVKVEGVPPEEFLVDRWAKSVDEATFVGQRTQMTKSELRSLGFKDEQLADLPWGNEQYYGTDRLRMVREAYNGNFTQGFDDPEAGEANEKVWVVEAYVRIDYDGDGLAELRKIMFVGNTLLSNEEWDLIPFSTITPNPIQHELFGQSVYDAVKDIQDVKTALLRNQLDNMYLINKGRWVVVDGQVNLNDLQNNVPGGIIREKMQGALRPLDPPMLPQGTYEMTGYMDELKTNRTGVSARTQGLDDKVLNSHTGASQVNKVMSVAEQRLKLVARIFAETGVKDMFSNIAKLVTKYQNKEEVFRLNGQFVRINPASWKYDSELRITVGMGTKDKDQQAMLLQRLMEMQQTVINNGGMGILTNETKIYNLLKEFTDNAGYKDVEKFWLDPTTEEAQQAKQALMQAQSKPKPDEIKANAEAQKKQADAQKDQMQLQQEQKFKEMEMQMAQLEMQLKEREMSLKEREAALEEDKQDMERDKFEWQKQVQIAEVVLEKEAGKAVSIGDNKLFKGRNKGKADSGNTGE